MAPPNSYGINDKVKICQYGNCDPNGYSKELVHGSYNLSSDFGFADNQMSAIYLPHFVDAKISDKWSGHGNSLWLRGPKEIPILGDFSGGGRGDWENAVSYVEVEFMPPNNDTIYDCCWGDNPDEAKCGPFSVDSDICKKTKGDLCDAGKTDLCDKPDPPPDTSDDDDDGGDDDGGDDDGGDDDVGTRTQQMGSVDNGSSTIMVFLFIIFIAIIIFSSVAYFFILKK